MKKTHLFKIFCLLGITLFSIRQVAAQAMYTVNTAEEADVVVYVTDSEATCDLKVFFVEETSQLGKSGVWLGTFEPEKANKKIYFTFTESEAQLKIFVVDEESKAGWVKEDKKKLIET
ncbi:MAG: hypothetical protein HC906_18325 [Bacteroidales bacterium]|nr:hypothetical protein [Bacteroidales bacterium]